MVWSAGGSGGLTTEQLDAALDSTSRNLLRVRSTTITTANCSTTSVSMAKITTTTIAVQGTSPDFDYSTNFIMSAINSAFTVADDTAGVNAYCIIKIDKVIDCIGPYTFTGIAASAAMQGTTPVPFDWPITGNFVGLPEAGVATPSSYPYGDIKIEVWGHTNGSGTALITDISHKYWSYRGA